MIQLPDDVMLVCYRQNPMKPYQFDPVFNSIEKNFTGTEEDFVKVGYAYRYIQIDKFTRIVIEGKE